MNKNLYVCNELFRDDYETASVIEKVADGDRYITISADGTNIYFEKSTGKFTDRHDREIKISFNKKSHRTKYLKYQITRLKNRNETLNKEILENWQSIKDYQSELMCIK